MDNLMDITAIAEAIILLIMAIITCYLVPMIKARLDNEQLAKVRVWVDIAVNAAEKLYGAGKGDEKLKYAEGILLNKGIKLDTMALKAMIDAAIKKMEQVDWAGVAIEYGVDTNYADEFSDM